MSTITHCPNRSKHCQRTGGEKQSLESTLWTVWTNSTVNSASTKLFGTKKTTKMNSGDETSKVGHKFPGETANKAKSEEQWTWDWDSALAKTGSAGAMGLNQSASLIPT